MHSINQVKVIKSWHVSKVERYHTKGVSCGKGPKRTTCFEMKANSFCSQLPIKIRKTTEVKKKTELHAF